MINVRMVLTNHVIIALYRIETCEELSGGQSSFKNLNISYQWFLFFYPEQNTISVQTNIKQK